MYTHLEDYINKLYKYLAVSNPGQLTIDTIANRLKLNIFYGNVSFRCENNIVIKKSNPHHEWISFGHEICHFLKHVGSQARIHYLFMEMQEYQANNFAYHFCVPTFMLEDIRDVNIYDVMQLFCVDFDFAYTRLEMYKSKMIGSNKTCS